MMWPNFYIGGILKLFGDLLSVVPAVGLGVILNFIHAPNSSYDVNSEVSLEEFFSNGYVMLLIVTLALIFQAILSQNSTHLITVQGTRLKMALQVSLMLLAMTNTGKNYANIFQNAYLISEHDLRQMYANCILVLGW